MFWLVLDKAEVHFFSVWPSTWPNTIYWTSYCFHTITLPLCHKSGDHINAQPFLNTLYLSLKLVCYSSANTTLLIAILFQKVLILNGVNQAIFFLFNIALDIIRPLYFYMNFRMILWISANIFGGFLNKNLLSIYLSIYMYLYTNIKFIIVYQSINMVYHFICLGI